MATLHRNQDRRDPPQDGREGVRPVTEARGLARSAGFTGPDVWWADGSKHQAPQHPRRPLHLIYYEAYVLAKDAKARELFLKSGSGKRFIRKQLSHYFSTVR